ncbi:unnamed protein product [Paramecium octaurelia]|uniref:Uncharacterized protein n=1 Tax=Paramecium octaurelia TaxID=43137 RepID=A0A8S1W5L6_PAROT|nr:unnamed protein product [Paramecium octaurelia]
MVHIVQKKKFSQCIDAGGVYNEGDGSKIGVWIELDEEFNDDKQVIYKGEFKNGKKVGLWVEMKRDMDKIEEGFEKIQEIKYDN